MPKIFSPTEITKIVSVDPSSKPGDKGVTVMVEVFGGPEVMVLKMTPEVASDLHTAVCEE